ncbi:MAG: hypothetical protein WC558_14835 [Patulibacter sp.]
MNNSYSPRPPLRTRSRFRRIAVASATAIAIATAGAAAGAAAAPANALSLDNDIRPPRDGTPVLPGPAPGDYPTYMGYTPLFSKPQLRRNYTIRLVGTDSEPFRSAAAFAAQQFQMETVADVAITVAPGTIAEPSPSSTPNTGEILLDVAAAPKCGNLTACTQYPTLTPWPDGLFRIDGGHIWLAPAVATYSTALIRTIVSHQLGHALGLDHNNTVFDGTLQVMNTVAQTWTAGAYQEGDKFGQSIVSPYGILQRNDTPPVALGPWRGVPERAFGGAWTDVALRGDWNGDGIDTLAFWGDRLTGVGAEQSPRFHLNEEESSIWIRYGNAGDIPIAGDWNGDGIDTIGVLRGDTFHLRNSNAPVSSFTTFSLAELTTNPLGPHDKVLTGDWNGDGIDTIGIYRSHAGSGAWYLANSNTQNTTYHIFSFGFGSAGSDKPVVGDWDGNGTDTVGVKRGEQWTLRNARTSQEFNLPQFADVNTTFGEADDTPLAGDWDGDGDDTVGVSRNKRF